LMLPVLMGAWFALFRWVLPAVGVPTCLSGTCGTVPRVELVAGEGERCREGEPGWLVADRDEPLAAGRSCRRN